MDTNSDNATQALVFITDLLLGNFTKEIYLAV